MSHFYKRIRLPVLLLLPILTMVESVNADLISFSIHSQVSAEVDLLGTATDSSDLASDQLLAMVGSNGTGVPTGPTTMTALDYAWNGSTLTGISRIEQTSPIDSPLGSRHHGQSQLYFTFTVDSLTDFVLDGSYGFVGATGTDDTASWLLAKSDLTYSQFGKAGDSCTTIDEHTFTSEGRLEEGTYTLVLTADLSENFNESGSREAGWTLDEFTLVTVVPEPNAFGFLAMIISTVTISVRRRTHQL